MSAVSPLSACCSGLVVSVCVAVGAGEASAVDSGGSTLIMYTNAAPRMMTGQNHHRLWGGFFCLPGGGFVPYAGCSCGFISYVMSAVYRVGVTLRGCFLYG